MDLEIKRDKFYYPFTLTGTPQIIVNGATVSLLPGTYYAHNDAALNSSYPSFYIMLVTQLNTFSPSWAVEAIAPSGSVLRSGIRLKRTTGTFSSLDLSGTTGIVKRLLGFAENDTSTIVATSNAIDGEFSSFGYWSPHSLFDGRATMKDSAIERITEWSSPHPEVATAIVWRERSYRVIKYEYVFGAYIYSGRNTFDNLSEVALRPIGDAQNTLEDLFLYAGRSNGTLIATYDMDDLELDVDNFQYEFLKIADQKSVQRMDSIAKRSNYGGDFWEVEIPFVIIGGSYGL